MGTKTIEIPTVLWNRIASYIETRPVKEVAQIWDEMRAALQLHTERLKNESAATDRGSDRGVAAEDGGA